MSNPLFTVRKLGETEPLGKFYTSDSSDLSEDEKLTISQRLGFPMQDGILFDVTGLSCGEAIIGRGPDFTSESGRKFWVYQGEAEAEGNANNVHAYGPQMHTLFESLKNDLGVPIVFVQLGPNPGDPYWPEIQVIQSWIAEGAPPWVRMVTAADLRTLAPNNRHLNQASYITLGGRMGDAMYQLLSGSTSAVAAQ